MQMALSQAHAASCILIHQQSQHGRGSLPRPLEEPLAPGQPTAAAWQDTGFSEIPICALPALQMAAPTHQLPPMPQAVSAASIGAVAFQSWLADEEEEWRLSQRLEASCPKEFKCPISLDIMQDPIILVRPVHQHAHRGSLCSAEAGTLSLVVHSESPCGCTQRMMICKPLNREKQNNMNEEHH